MPSSLTSSSLGRVGVVTVTYNSAEVVGQALDALPRERLGGVVVVDNASVDASREVVAARDCVDLVVLEDNVGFGRGCNAGAERLPGCELLLFLNPDAVVVEPDLARLVAHLDSHPRCAVVGPRLFRDGQELSAAGDLASPVQLLRLVAPALLLKVLRPWRHDPTYDRSGPVGYVEGACFLVRREAFEAAGGFDPRYFLFFEEMDLARRLRASWTVDLCAEARATHLVAVSRRSVEHGARPHLLRSASLYVDRWYGERAGRVFRTAARLLVRLRARRGLAASAPTLLAALRGSP